jgi:hypothetical protein
MPKAASLKTAKPSLPKQKKTAKPPKLDAKPKIKARKKSLKNDDFTEVVINEIWVVKADEDLQAAIGSFSEPVQAPKPRTWWDQQMHDLFNLFSRK